MKAIVRRLRMLEARKNREPLRPTSFLGINVQTASDEQLEAMALVARALDQRETEDIDVCGSLRASVDFLIASGAVIPPKLTHIAGQGGPGSSL